MDEYKNVKINLHPCFKAMVAAQIEINTEELRTQAMLQTATFEQVKSIVAKQPHRKQAAFYGAVAETAAGGADFSNAKTIEDIAEVYITFIVGRAFDG